MGKQIYIPTMDELYTMQDMDINIYNYLLAKVIELLTLEGVVYYNKGILNHEYKYIRENPEIARAICSMYPQEIENSQIAKCDTNLCLDLITGPKDNVIYNLDNLALFNDLALNNMVVAKTTIDILDKQLPKNPKYRFEYRENKLLHSIFSTEFINSMLYNPKLLEQLSRIEPAYILKDEEIENKTIKREMLINAIKSYVARYKLSSLKGDCCQYDGKDILTTPDENTKRLIRHIEKKKNNIY